MAYRGVRKRSFEDWSEMRRRNWLCLRPFLMGFLGLVVGIVFVIFYTEIFPGLDLTGYKFIAVLPFPIVFVCLIELYADLIDWLPYWSPMAKTKFSRNRIEQQIEEQVELRMNEELAKIMKEMNDFEAKQAMKVNREVPPDLGWHLTQKDETPEIWLDDKRLN